MPRPRSGQLIERQAQDGRVFAARWHVGGRRVGRVLGREARGYTREKAEAELQALLRDAERGVGPPPLPPPRGIVPVNPPRRQPPRPRPSHFYVIRSIEGPPRVKLGITTDVQQRLATLQACSPVRLEVVAAWPTPKAQWEEVRHHTIFRDARLHGEWFDATHPELAHWLAEVHAVDLGAWFAVTAATR